MIIVADIGGTHVRLAQVLDSEPIDTKKYKTADFADIQSVLLDYCGDETGELLIAAAGAPHEGLWKITNNPAWDINLKALEDLGWHVPLILNDFEAGTYALPVLNEADLKTLKAGRNNDQALCVLGPGTGLGLGYFHPPGFVQKTHGGHMPITAVTDEQWDCIKAFQAQKRAAVVYEDFVSGQNDFVKTHPELFHEFLGLFAAQSVIHGHAYGGLYLTGGVIEALIEEGKFNFDTFYKYFCVGGVECVKQDLENTPIYYIADPYPALKGLIHAKSLSDD